MEVNREHRANRLPSLCGVDGLAAQMTEDITEAEIKATCESLFTPVNLKAMAAIEAMECIPLDGTAGLIVATLQDAGLQITEKPQRKPLPDAPGWWFVSQNNQGWMVIEVALRDGDLVRIIRRELPTIGQRVEHMKCDAAFGPLEVPT